LKEKNQKRKQTKMNIVNRKGLTLSQFGLLIIIAVGLAVFSTWLAKMPDKKEVPQGQTKKVEAPEEIIEALANLEGDVGSIEEQREDISHIAEALRIGTATSESLGKKGNDYWLTELRRRVDVREAMEAWEELKRLDAKSMSIELSRQELAKIPRLRKIVEAQILSAYAKDEGLTCNFAQVDNLVTSITKDKEK